MMRCVSAAVWIVGAVSISGAAAQDRGIDISIALNPDALTQPIDLRPGAQWNAPHLGGDALFSILNKEQRLTVDTVFDFGVFANFEAGYAVTEQFRIEAEFSYFQHDVDIRQAFILDNQDLDDEESDVGLVFQDVDLDPSLMLVDGRGVARTRATFANGIYELPEFGPRIVPFVGAGVGLAQIDIDYRGESGRPDNQSDTVVAFQVLVGAQIDVGRRGEITMGARYRGMGETSISIDLLPPELALEGEGVVGEFGFRRRF